MMRPSTRETYRPRSKLAGYDSEPELAHWSGEQGACAHFRPSSAGRDLSVGSAFGPGHLALHTLAAKRVSLTVLPKDHYDTLGLKEGANPDAIRRAYRRLARQLHPDVNSRANAADRMSAVNEAYEVLNDSERKAAYDALRRTGISSAPSASTERKSAIVRHHLSIIDLPSPAYSIDFSQQRDELAVGCFDNTVRFASARTGRSLAETQLEGGAVAALRWTGRTRLVAVGVSEKSVSIWRLRDRKTSNSIVKRADWISPIAIDPLGRYVVLGSVHRKLTGLDVDSGRILFEKRAHEDSISAIAISSGGHLIASGGNDQRVALWGSDGLQKAQIGPLRAAVATLAFSDDGSQLAVSLIDHGIRVFDIQSGFLRCTLWGHEKSVETLAFHPGGGLLASGSRDGSTRLWDPIGGKPVDVLGGHTGPAKTVAFSPSGLFLASGGLDKVVSIWRVAV